MANPIGIYVDKINEMDAREVGFSQAVDDVFDNIMIFQVGGYWTDDGYTKSELIALPEKEADDFLTKVAKIWQVGFNDEELMLRGKDPTRLLQAMSYVFGTIMMNRCFSDE